MIRYFILISLLFVNNCLALPEGVRDFKDRSIPIKATLGEVASFGTAWRITDTLICTAYHVVAQGQEIFAIEDGKIIELSLASVDKTHDIAMLYAPGKKTQRAFPATTDYGDQTYMWSYVPSVGNENNLPVPVLNEGKIASIGSYSTACPSEILIDSTIFGGASGSAAINSQGELIGLVLGVRLEFESKDRWYICVCPAKFVEQLLRRTPKN